MPITIWMRTRSNGRTAAMAFPLFVGIATPDRAQATAKALGPVIGEGGLRTTLVDTGQQWDDPNGWAPLQWVAITGSNAMAKTALARRIAAHWLASVTANMTPAASCWKSTNVVQRLPGGGGEYPLQDGFGWTNGVTRALIAKGFTTAQ